MAEDNGKAKTKATKRCFFISEFGVDEKARLERKQTLKHLVKKVLEPMGYEVQRADEIDDLGQITHQIIERLLDDDLVVADLTGLNPNVFYELAVRHAARKPVITLMTDGESIPFDLKDVRTVFYDLHDPDRLERAQEELTQKARTIESNPEEVRNPITVARDVTLFQQSDDPDTKAAGAVLSAVNELRDEMQVLSRRIRTSEGRSARRRPALGANAQLEKLFADGRDYTTEQVIESVDAPAGWVRNRLEQMRAEEKIFLVDGKWSPFPF